MRKVLSLQRLNEKWATGLRALHLHFVRAHSQTRTRKHAGSSLQHACQSVHTSITSTRLPALGAASWERGGGACPDCTSLLPQLHPLGTAPTPGTVGMRMCRRVGATLGDPDPCSQWRASAPEGVACVWEEEPGDRRHWSQGHSNPFREGLGIPFCGSTAGSPTPCPHLGYFQKGAGRGDSWGRLGPQAGHECDLHWVPSPGDGSQGPCSADLRRWASGQAEHTLTPDTQSCQWSPRGRGGMARPWRGGAVFAGCVVGAPQDRKGPGPTVVGGARAPSLHTNTSPLL